MIGLSSFFKSTGPVVVAAICLFAPLLHASGEENLLKAGSFELGETNGLPAGWTLWNSKALHDSLRTIEVVEESGNHFVRLRDKNAQAPDLPAVNFLLISTEVPLKPGQEKLVVSYRMKALVNGIGSHPIFGPRIRIHFEMPDGSAHIQNSKSQIKDMSGWTQLTETVEVPKGARKMFILAGLFGCTGYACFDDIEIRVP